MAIITFTIEASKVSAIVEGFVKLYPNTETIPDPSWVDPEDGSEAPEIPAYTDVQWVKERVRRFITQSSHRGAVALASRTAAVAVESNHDAVS